MCRVPLTDMVKPYHLPKILSPFGTTLRPSAKTSLTRSPLSSTLRLLKYDSGDFGDNIEVALEAVSPRVFAATTKLSEAPNTLLQAAKGFKECTLYEKIDLGLPLQQCQIEELRNMGLLVHDQQLGVVTIQSKDLNILNPRWNIWIQNATEQLIREKFVIHGTTIHFEGALVVTMRRRFKVSQMSMLFRNVCGIRLTSLQLL